MENRWVVVVAKDKDDFWDFCIEKGLIDYEFSVMPPEELGLTKFNLEKVASPILGIEDLKYIPLTDSLCETYDALKKARDRV